MDVGSTSLVLEHRDQLVSTIRTAAETAAAGNQPFFLASADNDLPESGSVTLTPPCAYNLAVDQFTECVRCSRCTGSSRNAVAAS